MMNNRNKKGIFREFWNLKENGQIFPFLIVVIILLLVALMAYINLSQVNLRKLSTMNAADAAALAAASELASIANNIAYVNKSDLQDTYDLDWVGVLKHFVHMDTICISARYGEYLGFVAGQLATYLGLVNSGYVGTQQAGGSALQLALSNMPIEEAARRKGSYDGEIQKSAFSEWLDDVEIYTPASNTVLERSYEWNQYSYNVTEGRQVKQPQPERVTVKIDKPDHNAFVLTPFPSVDFTLFWDLYLGLPCCSPVCPDACTLACGLALSAHTSDLTLMAAEQLAATIIITAEYAIATAITLMDQDVFGPAVYYELAALGVEIALMAIAMTPIPIVVPTSCPYFGLYVVIWPIPIAYIASMGDLDDYEVSVEVTRFSPAKNLGLFQFKEQKITSGARAGIAEGHIFAPGSYKVKVYEVWDGERI